MRTQDLLNLILTKRNFLLVGLDSDIDKLPKHFSRKPSSILDFNRSIIEATRNYCIGYKINTAFYESLGSAGIKVLEETLSLIPSGYFTIADAKRADIGNTSKHYAKTFFETMCFDAVTVAPYMGYDSIEPFLVYTNKHTIVLALTSNLGAHDFQMLSLQSIQNKEIYLFEYILEKVSQWTTANNLMFVIGATQLDFIDRVRRCVPEHFLLVPGIGAQGGDFDELCHRAIHPSLVSLLTAVSRDIIFASNDHNFAEMAHDRAKLYQQKMEQILQQINLVV
ncbi:MAG: orotidine-5'-phosphate decarboxylase [Phycisphaerales bacterium]|nr:orotidine-5'-phosphate decarboxylase [Phycisphaerales bacterium]